MSPYLSQVASAGAVDVLLGIGELQVHVPVGRDQEALWRDVYVLHEQKTLGKANTRAFQHVSYLVLMAPLQLDHDCLASESIEEGLGVHGHGSHPEFGLAL